MTDLAIELESLSKFYGPHRGVEDIDPARGVAQRDSRRGSAGVSRSVVTC